MISLQHPFSGGRAKEQGRSQEFWYGGGRLISVPSPKGLMGFISFGGGNIFVGGLTPPPQAHA